MKHINQAAVVFLNQVRKTAAKEGIRATHAVKMLIDEMPELGRAECYNSATVAGINKLTARNVWDKNHH